MPLSPAPKFQIPFNNNAVNRNTIPVASQIGITPGIASYTDGFVPLNMTPVASGGVPPFGQDMNGILFAITNALQWQQATAGGYAYDSAFQTQIGGYPIGSIVQRSDGTGFWLNTVANNLTAPESGGAGWQPLDAGATSVAMSNANVTLTALQAAKSIIIITGTLTANLNLIFPAYAKQWVVVNSATGAFTVTAKTAAGSGVIVSTGGNKSVYGDGTNIVSEQVTGGLIGAQVFLVNGTYTPSPGTTSVIVEMVGGGAAGGGAAITAAGAFSIGGGGGSGGYTKTRLTSGFAGAAIVVGSGGAPVSAATGGNGGASSFGGALVTAAGGLGGSAQGNAAAAVLAAGGGGAALGATGNIANAGGAVGGYGIFVPSGANFPIGGTGGSSFFGGGGFSATAGVGGAGLAPGAGGGGSSNQVSSAARVGGAGAAGLVIVYEYS